MKPITFIQVDYQKTSKGWSAIYHDSDGDYLGMTELFDSIEGLQAIVTLQLAVWLN